MYQLNLFNNFKTPDLSSYDHIVLATSGGKDSLACLLYLLSKGVPLKIIELWHHLIDGPT